MQLFFVSLNSITVGKLTIEILHVEGVKLLLDLGKEKVETLPECILGVVAKVLCEPRESRSRRGVATFQRHLIQFTCVHLGIESICSKFVVLLIPG